MYFHVYKNMEGKFCWRLVAANHRTLAYGADHYASKRGALQTIDNIEEAIRNGEVSLLDTARNK